ncbi:hypothetical protein Tco_0686234 [Tanacetum coccineum]
MVPFPVIFPPLGFPLKAKPPSGTPPLLPIPLPTPSPPLLLPSTVCRAGVFEVTLLPQKRLCISLGLRYEVSKSSSAPTARPTRGLRWIMVLLPLWMMRSDVTLRDVGYGITDTWDEMLVGMQDTDEIYVRLDEAEDARAREARLSREAWGWSMDASNTARSEVRALQTTVLSQQAEIGALRAAYRT